MSLWQSEWFSEEEWEFWDSAERGCRSIFTTPGNCSVNTSAGAAADLLSDVCADPPAADGGRLNEEKNVLSGLSRSAEPVNAEWNPRKSVGTLQSSTGERPIGCLIIFSQSKAEAWSLKHSLHRSILAQAAITWRRRGSGSLFLFISLFNYHSNLLGFGPTATDKVGDLKSEKKVFMRWWNQNHWTATSLKDWGGGGWLKEEIAIVAIKRTLWMQIIIKR